MENGIQEFNLEERLEQFRRLFASSLNEYGRGRKLQKQNYVDHKRYNGMNDIGVRGINSFGIKFARRAVYIKNGRASYEGFGYADHYELNLLLAPKMEDDSSINLEMDKHYKPIPIKIDYSLSYEERVEQMMKPVEEIFLMTNAEVMRRFNVRYPFSYEMLERFRNEDDQIIHSNAVQDLKASLAERLRLEQQQQQQQTGPGYTEPLVW